MRSKRERPRDSELYRSLTEAVEAAWLIVEPALNKKERRR
jgi:hypothetical protein